MSASFFGILKNHNHTNTVGDGGQLSGLSVTNGLTVASGDLGVSAGDVSGENVHATVGTVDEAGTPTLAAECPRFDQALLMSFLFGS